MAIHMRRIYCPLILYLCHQRIAGWHLEEKSLNRQKFVAGKLVSTVSFVACAVAVVAVIVVVIDGLVGLCVGHLGGSGTLVADTTTKTATTTAPTTSARAQQQ